MAFIAFHVITLVVCIENVLPVVHAKQGPESVCFKEQETTNIFCSENEALVFTSWNQTGGREERDGCSRFIIGKLNNHCKFRVSCSLQAHYKVCLTGYETIRFDYYCVLTTSVHRGCNKTIITSDDYAPFGILTSSSYPNTNITRTCTYELRVPAEYQIRLRVFNCYFRVRIHDVECTHRTNLPMDVILRNTSCIRIHEKAANYAGFLAFYNVEPFGNKTKATVKEMMDNRFHSCDNTGSQSTRVDKNRNMWSKISIHSTPTHPPRPNGRYHVFSASFIEKILWSSLAFIFVCITCVACWLYKRKKYQQTTESDYENMNPRAAADEHEYDQLHDARDDNSQDYQNVKYVA